MRIEDLVDRLGVKIDRRLVLHKELKIQKVKAIKVFRYEVFMIDDPSMVVLQKDFTANVSLDDVDAAWKKYDVLFIDEVLDLIFSNKYPMVKIV